MTTTNCTFHIYRETSRQNTADATLIEMKCSCGATRTVRETVNSDGVRTKEDME